ncbi:GntR family transcriptional regulator [Salsuginibacillus kocurii]|uniref:GntR family transcriptional regulator n=1 Tax=Salsuginibacillus kocurii TaxID=427078 RepID=UPI00037BAB2A|nr:GntR family transcriptional regulator [Salsuginibacillus kocurii]
MRYEPLSEEDKRTIEDHVADSIRKSILLGDYERGERIVQESVANQLGVSRMPIREALKRLELEGLVKNEPRKGAVAYPITIDDIEEIYTLRSMHETLAVEKAYPFFTQNDFLELGDILEEMENVQLVDDNIDYYSKLNKAYHKKMIEKCPWRRVKQNLELLWTGFLPIASPMLLKDHHEKAKQEHRQIFEALKAGNMNVIKTVTEFHIERNKSSLISSMKDHKKSKV